MVTPSQGCRQSYLDKQFFQLVETMFRMYFRLSVSSIWFFKKEKENDKTLFAFYGLEHVPDIGEN